MARWRNQTMWNTALISAVFLVVIDRLLKSVSILFWQEHPQTVFTFLHLVFSKNQNIAFSLDTFFNPLYIIVPILFFVLFYFFHTLKNQRLVEASALLFVISGAMSNLYDRFVYGSVIDYIDIKYFTIFNVADMMICGGIIFLILKTTKTSG
jgi:signal peptidase II